MYKTRYELFTMSPRGRQWRKDHPEPTEPTLTKAERRAARKAKKKRGKK